jgi:predicted Zn-dependent protease with MMP-like domain
MVGSETSGAPEAELADRLYLEAIEAFESGGPKAALVPLQRAVETDSSHADAHHALGICFAELDDFAAMTRHFLRTRELDEADDARNVVGEADDLEFIEKVAVAVLAELPEQFRERLHNVPIVLETRPHAGIVAEGFDPRALGLFEGQTDAEAEIVATAPTRIVLYTSNLLCEFHDDEELAEEIEVTILHEIGHFFGLDEDEVAALGLE